MEKDAVSLGDGGGPTEGPVIEKDIPLPDRQRYNFRRMVVGDSVVLCYSKDRKSMAMRARGAASQIGRRYGMRFSIKIVPGGVRVWRTR